jgi:hypothetical protein
MSQAASLERLKGIENQIDEVIAAPGGWANAFSTK